MHTHDAIRAGVTISGACSIFFNYLKNTLHVLRGEVRRSDTCMQKAIEHALEEVTYACNIGKK